MLGRKGFVFSWSAWPVLVLISVLVAIAAANEWSGNKLYLFVLSQSCRLFGRPCELTIPVSMEVLEYRHTDEIRSLPVIVRLAPGSMDDPERDYVVSYVTEKLIERGVSLVDDEWKAKLGISLYFERSEKNHPAYPVLRGYGESEYFAHLGLTEMDVKIRDGRYRYLDHTTINAVEYNCFGDYASARTCYSFFIDEYVDALMAESDVASGVVLKSYSLAR